MKRTARPLAALAVILVLSCLTSAPLLAQSGAPAENGDSYSSGDLARVTYEENGVTIRRAFAEDGLPPVSEATMNAPIYAGDAILTDADQRAEAQLAGGTLVRIDQSSDLTFLGLPDPAAEFSDNSVLQLAEGTIRVTAHLAEGEEFRVDTPAASVYFLGDGDFRIEVTPGGRTEVVSRRGVAEVVGNGGSILVRGGTRTEVFPGTLPEEPWAFNTFVTDAFDQWVDSRNAIYEARDRYAGASDYSGETYEALPDEIRPYYQELNRNGSWVYAPEYGYVWYPTGVPAAWRPYYDGYWDYGPGGWFWVSYEPWGWAPYHYGRWNWLAGYGWCWAPGRIFAGAWVAWSWGSLYVGWAPLDYWGRPCYAGSIAYGYYDPHVWTFVSYNYVGSRTYQRHAVRVDDVGDELRHATVVSRAPRVPPRRLATSGEERARAMRLVQQDRADRLQPIDRSVRPSTSMRDVERRARSTSAPGRAFDTTRDRGSRALSRGTSSSGPARAESNRGASRGTAGRTAGQAGSRGTVFPAYPRRISSDPARGRAGASGSGRTGSGGAERGGRNVGGQQRREGAPTAPVRARDAEASEGSGRLPDFYRRMASPRTTPDRTDRGSSEQAPRGRADGSRRGEPGRSNGRNAAPAPRQRDTSGSRTPNAPRARESKPDSAGSSERPSQRSTEPRGRSQQAQPKKKDDGSSSARRMSVGVTRSAPARSVRVPAPSRVAGSRRPTTAPRAAPSAGRRPDRSAGSRPAARPPRSTASRSAPRPSNPPRGRSSAGRNSGSRGKKR